MAGTGTMPQEMADMADSPALCAAPVFTFNVRQQQSDVPLQWRWTRIQKLAFLFPLPEGGLMLPEMRKRS